MLQVTIQRVRARLPTPPVTLLCILERQAANLEPSVSNIIFLPLHLPQVHGVSAADGIVTLVAGNPDGSSGTANGVGTYAMFNNPTGLSFNTDGSLIIGDYYNHVIRMLSSSGPIC